MKIHGFQSLTLLDYPGKVACTVFLGGCNFRCPFCQNTGLVLAPEREAVVPMEEVMGVLRKRRGMLDGVCITGGEPTLTSDLREFILRVRELGYLVKLDTNGYRPEVLENLLAEGLLDYVAMDIKSSPENYARVAGLPGLDLQRIRHSVELLMGAGVDYEFRTTVAQGLHTREDIEAIGRWLQGCRRYFLQNYRESEQVMMPVFAGFSREQLENFRRLLLEYIPQVGIRGV
ncbi:MAG TPA: anaerobic ribonucleoside-triphosphate reductase activating protein [Candidatus Egerieimonas intestinavium]|uniref:Anaerobic ribonucleoside-triphosphate reductase activating protein n=1 Tax=Candidatus Egerieimonas intestinavium TaxID=2840777 RepID=A0A9D1EHY7_9FIRM|nr:anaerobic ribonucleoside-triphosphate reductase activating protein [Candidatus Egerieimonas intestinavium]